MRRFLVGVLAMFVAVALSANSSAAPVPQDKPKEKTDAEKLVGKWKLSNTDSNLPKDAIAIVEYTKDGKMIITISLPDSDEKIEMKGTYKLEKNKIDYKVTLPNGEEKTEILTIKKLTEDELSTTDPDGIKEEFKRMKPEKKKD